MINLNIELRNPPIGATMWSLSLTDWNITVPIHEASGKERLDIAEMATFEIPGGLVLPLRVVALQITKWNEDMTALIQLYYAQSIHPTLWDWDKMDWGDVPDPTYREVFIPELGDYYYDVSNEEFVLTGALPIIDNTSTTITALMVMGILIGMMGMIMPAMKEVF